MGTRKRGGRPTGLSLDEPRPRKALPFDELASVSGNVPGALQGGLVGWRKKSEPPPLGIVGGGLAGCLAAVYLAQRGESVRLFEFRPVRRPRRPLRPPSAIRSRPLPARRTRGRRPVPPAARSTSR